MNKYILIITCLLFGFYSEGQTIKYSDLSSACSDEFKQKLFEMDYETPDQNTFVSKFSKVIFHNDKTLVKINNKKDYNKIKSEISQNCKQVDFSWNESIKSYETSYKCSSSSKNLKSSSKIKTYKTVKDSTETTYIFEVKCNNFNKKIMNIDNKLNLDIKE